MHDDSKETNISISSSYDNETKNIYINNEKFAVSFISYIENSYGLNVYIYNIYIYFNIINNNMNKYLSFNKKHKSHAVLFQIDHLRYFSRRLYNNLYCYKIININNNNNNIINRNFMCFYIFFSIMFDKFFLYKNKKKMYQTYDHSIMSVTNISFIKQNTKIHLLQILLFI